MPPITGTPPPVDFEELILHWTFPSLEFIDPLRYGLGLRPAEEWESWLAKNLEFPISRNTLYKVGKGRRNLSYAKATALFMALRKSYKNKLEGREFEYKIEALITNKPDEHFDLYQPKESVPVEEVRRVFQKMDYSQAPVVDEKGEMVGIVTTEMLASVSEPGLTVGDVKGSKHSWPVFPTAMPLKAILNSFWYTRAIIAIDESGKEHIITAWDVNNWLVTYGL
ncbi:MAG: CBS domain-containing protein [Candidatus Poseidoniia archaeon]|jgi:predicted transcriptional regulator|nr:CBS domain-containing protein [Candidatus Poseidoniia archaeon]